MIRLKIPHMCSHVCKLYDAEGQWAQSREKLELGLEEPKINAGSGMDLALIGNLYTLVNENLIDCPVKT